MDADCCGMDVDRLASNEDMCWVCLEGASASAGRLEYPCACPRGVHAKCLARWNLQQAGREEERFCRFCKQQLPDWRGILAPKVPAAPPVMAIVYDGKVVRLQVKPGREGMEEFQRSVRAAFHLGDDVELDCVFDCRAPGTGEKIKLRGLESYQAAMHCAAVAAGERLARTGTGSSAGLSPTGSQHVLAAGGAAGRECEGACGAEQGPPEPAGCPGAGAAWGHGSAGVQVLAPPGSSLDGAAAGGLTGGGMAPLQGPGSAGGSSSGALAVVRGAGEGEAEGACGARAGSSSGGSADSASPGPSPGRGRSLLSGLLRSLASARRVY